MDDIVEYIGSNNETKACKKHKLQARQLTSNAVKGIVDDLTASSYLITEEYESLKWLCIYKIK